AVKDSRVWLCDLKTGKEVRIFKSPNIHVRVQCLAFAPGGKVLAVGMWATDVVHLWDPGAGKLLRELHWGPPPPDLDAVDPEPVREPPKGLADLAFSPDGKTVAAACCDGHVRLWEVATAGRRHRALAPAGRLAFSPDGGLLATSTSIAGSVHLWD